MSHACGPSDGMPCLIAHIIRGVNISRYLSPNPDATPSEGFYQCLECGMKTLHTSLSHEELLQHGSVLYCANPRCGTVHSFDYRGLIKEEFPMAGN